MTHDAVTAQLWTLASIASRCALAPAKRDHREKGQRTAAPLTHKQDDEATIKTPHAPNRAVGGWSTNGSSHDV